MNDLQNMCKTLGGEFQDMIHYEECRIYNADFIKLKSNKDLTKPDRLSIKIQKKPKEFNITFT